MSMTRNEFLQEAALRSLQGLLAYSHDNQNRHTESLVEEALEYADALTREFIRYGVFYEGK